MIKHWGLYESISNSQIKQLYTAGISVEFENDTVETEFPIHGKVQIVRNQIVHIKTVNEKQETLLYLMFSGRVRLIGCENDLPTYW